MSHICAKLLETEGICYYWCYLYLHDFFTEQEWRGPFSSLVDIFMQTIWRARRSKSHNYYSLFFNGLGFGVWWISIHTHPHNSHHSRRINSQSPKRSHGQQGPWADRGKEGPPVVHPINSQFCLFDLLAFWLLNSQSFYMRSCPRKSTTKSMKRRFRLIQLRAIKQPHFVSCSRLGYNLPV